MIVVNALQYLGLQKIVLPIPFEIVIILHRIYLHNIINII